MKGLAAILAALALAACQSTPTLPEVTTRVVTVDKPYPVPCITPEKVPPYPPAPAIAADADIEQRVAWARIRNTQLHQHAVILRALLVACTSPPGGIAP